MDNRDRDKMSRNTESTQAGDVNRETSRRKSEESSDSSAEFGQNIGRSENLENEPSRRSGSLGKSSGVTGSKSGSNSQIDESDRSGSSRSEH